ncbi:MAG: hypothetical protein GKR87_11795 [Kiritimatiellae bacterium]|nr:hypothetical protein [Kiritimatiellia bacterium]
MSIATAEIRRRAIDAYKMGKGSQADIASSYRVDLRTFQRGLSRFNETGRTAPDRVGIVRPSTAESSSRRWFNWGANIPMQRLKNSRT